MGDYKSEASINKILAQFQLANAAIHNVEKEQDESNFEVLLREALQSENEAIKIYETLKEKANAFGSAILEKAFDELASDERTHVGNLNYLLKLLCPSAEKEEQEGFAEEIKFQATTDSDD